MQAIQNLGLAVVSIIAGDIVDSKGYLFLEVFFGACLSSKLSRYFSNIRNFMYIKYSWFHIKILRLLPLMYQ